MRNFTLFLLAFIFAGTFTVAADKEYDVVIYGGTSAAVTAAIQVKN